MNPPEPTNDQSRCAWLSKSSAGRAALSAKHENILLHPAARLDAARMIVVSLGGRSGAMAKEARDNADVIGIVDCYADRGAVPKQVRVDRRAQALSSPRGDPHVSLVSRHW
jgi:hypothetical protein